MSLRTAFQMQGQSDFDPIVQNHLVIKRLLNQIANVQAWKQLDISRMLQCLQQYDAVLNVLNDPIQAVLLRQDMKTNSEKQVSVNNVPAYDIKQVVGTTGDDMSHEQLSTTQAVQETDEDNYTTTKCFHIAPVATNFLQSTPMTSHSSTGSRQQRSVQILIQRASQLLLQTPGGLTRDELCQSLSVDKRRMSAAISTPSALGLLIEPENCQVGTEEKPLSRLRMPGLRLVRNIRLEALCTQFLSFSEYYRLLQTLRQQLEVQIGHPARRPALGFIGRRIDALARPQARPLINYEEMIHEERESTIQSGQVLSNNYEQQRSA